MNDEKNSFLSNSDTDGQRGRNLVQGWRQPCKRAARGVHTRTGCACVSKRDAAQFLQYVCRIFLPVPRHHDGSLDQAIDFDANGNLFDSKAMMLEDLITEDQFDRLLVELYATSRVYEVIVHDDVHPERSKRLKNPNFASDGAKDELMGTLVWKRKRNSEFGGCTFSLLSVCTIQDEVIIVMN
ncbi:MAG: hypothetical protein IJU72_05525 [Bacteroidales bacterium]|nr:hypothetical protein [Bacteroidales bacterium]